jgi:hypothetical protein
MKSTTYQVCRKPNGKHYIKVIEAGRVIYVTQGEYYSGEDAMPEARQRQYIPQQPEITFPQFVREFIKTTIKQIGKRGENKR